MADHKVTLISSFSEAIHGEMNAAAKAILNRSMLHFAISRHRFFVMMFIPSGEIMERESV